MPHIDGRKDSAETAGRFVRPRGSQRSGIVPGGGQPYGVWSEKGKFSSLGVITALIRSVS